MSPPLARLASRLQSVTLTTMKPNDGRAFPSAPLPVAAPTTSYWLSQPHPSLENHVPSNLPQYADAVIIGSGISGALITREILAREPQARIVMIDARGICNGASGRNGGHIKPDCYKSFAKLQAKYGTDAAKVMCRFEVENMLECVRFIKDQKLADTIDLVETRSVDFYMTEESWKSAKASLRHYAYSGGNLSGIVAHEQREAAEVYRMKEVFGAVSYPACSLWPRKLVMSLIEKAVADGLQLFPHTPAVSIVADSNAAGNWLVKTERGTVSSPRVYHATNGYVSNLLPQFAGKVVPVKGNVAAIRPPPSFDATPLGHTAGIQWGIDFDYMIQRPTDGRPVIYGGRDLMHPRSLPGVIGDTDDSVVTPEIQEGLRKFPTRYLKGWGPDASVRYAWSGIMGFTADELPFVGAVPGEPGQFMAAGFNGHGMARVFLTIKGLMQSVYEEAVDPRVPAPYFEIQERMASRDEAWETLLSEAYAKDSKVAAKL